MLNPSMLEYVVHSICVCLCAQMCFVIDLRGSQGPHLFLLTLQYTVLHGTATLCLYESNSALMLVLFDAAVYFLACSPNQNSPLLYLHSQVVQLFPLLPEVLQARVVPVQSHISGIEY